MSKNKYPVIILILMALLAVNYSASAQRRKNKKPPVKVTIYDVDTMQHPVPRNRQVFQDKVDREQHIADASDGAVDNALNLFDDTNFNYTLTKSIIADIDHIQVMIENAPANGRDPATDNQQKILYIKAVWEMLRTYNRDTRVDPLYYRKLVTNLHDMIIALNENKLTEFIKDNINVQSMENGKVLFENHSDVRGYLYTEMGKQDPKMMIRRLEDFANEPFADDVIRDAARLVPSAVFNYASSTNVKLRTAVRRSSDPLVQTIVRIAERSRSPLKAMPFLGDIYTGKLTIPQVDDIAANPDLFYQNLVRLKLENDTLGKDTYTDELAYRGLKYVREMDDLHESPEAVRFKCIDGIKPEALYFILVYGQDEIYTSSFLGTFKRMMERMKPMKGDSLLAKVHYDHFRTFLRMCAGYNTLSQFLGTMDEGSKNALMNSFIAGLQKGKEDELEDAVDVADAFGSIRDSALASFLQAKVKENYETSYKQGSKKGMIVYSLLSMLFDGMRNTNNDSMALLQSQVLGLPPINMVPYKALLGDTTIVFEQYFFFGDEDGKASYGSFLGNFKDGKWKVTTDKYWSVIKSVTGKPVVIFANLPIPEPDDEEAQNKLCAYLENNNIHPTVMVHRGHSYHLPTTMDKLNKKSRIIVLGSCGGYHNLSIVLDHSPDAHIISSKQTGSMAINDPIIKAINNELLAGRDVNWIRIWRELEVQFSKERGDVKDKFSDYVPPYKNLGAIFIKAYRRKMNLDATD